MSFNRQIIKIANSFERKLKKISQMAPGFETKDPLNQDTTTREEYSSFSENDYSDQLSKLMADYDSQIIEEVTIRFCPVGTYNVKVVYAYFDGNHSITYEDLYGAYFGGPEKPNPRYEPLRKAQSLFSGRYWNTKNEYTDITGMNGTVVSESSFDKLCDAIEKNGVKVNKVLVKPGMGEFRRY